jgi:hypothetical protein
VKVVEGSQIYNFPIQHFVHFYSKFLRKPRSNATSPTQANQPDATGTPARAPARAAVPPRASAMHAAPWPAAASAPAPHAFPRVQRAFPMPRAPRMSCAPRRRTVSHMAPRSVGRRQSASAPRRRRQSTGQCKARTSPIKPLPPLASAHRTPSHRPEPPLAPVEAPTRAYGPADQNPQLARLPPFLAPTVARRLAPFSHRAAPRRELAAAAATTAVRRCARPPVTPLPN